MAKRHVSYTGNLHSVFVRLEELVLANSGQDEFEEVFKLIIAKIWDERGIKVRRFRTYESAAETNREICKLILEAEKAWPGILASNSSPLLAPDHLKVCVEAISQHMLSNESLEVMDNLFEFLVSRGSKGAKGQFFTPRYVIELCVRMLRPTKTETLLDPACGSGGFLIHALNYIRKSNGFSQECEDYSSKLWGFDFDPRAVRIAKAMMLLSGVGNSNIINLNSLLIPGSEFNLLNQAEDTESILTIEDICRSRMRHHQGFDIILTNPPFAGDVREVSILNKYALARGKSRIERDVLFLERCVQLLRPGGRMAIVLPHNILAIEAYRHVREWLLRRTHVLAVIGLGRNTFLPHTHQKTSIVFLRKYNTAEEPIFNPKIFFGISERDGKDTKGQLLTKEKDRSDGNLWDIVDHDFIELVDAFHNFCEGESIEVGK